MNHSQFDFRDVMIVVLGSGLGLAAIQMFGIVRVLQFHACLVLFFALIGWAVAHAYAPVLIRNATAILFVTVFTGSLLVCWVSQSREESRSNSCRNQLKELGLKLHERQALYPDAESKPAGEMSWPQYVQSVPGENAGP